MLIQHLEICFVACIFRNKIIYTEVFLTVFLTVCGFLACLQSVSSHALSSLVKGLPEALQRQYDYEDPIAKSGKHLMHSPFFKVIHNLFAVSGKAGVVEFCKKNVGCRCQLSLKEFQTGQSQCSVLA